MAVDTAAKRFSIMEDETTTPGIPMPDATIAAGDRQWFLWSYSGILWAAIVEVYHWVIPTNAPDGQVAEIVILADNWASIIETGQATATSSIWEFEATSTPSNGDKRLVFWHQWDEDKETVSIFGGAAIAEAVLQ